MRTMKIIKQAFFTTDSLSTNAKRKQGFHERPSNILNNLNNANNLNNLSNWKSPTSPNSLTNQQHTAKLVTQGQGYEGTKLGIGESSKTKNK